MARRDEDRRKCRVADCDLPHCEACGRHFDEDGCVVCDLAAAEAPFVNWHTLDDTDKTAVLLLWGD